MKHVRFLPSALTRFGECVTTLNMSQIESQAQI